MENTELYHYGIRGMKWGVRRYQNPDGSLTNVGKKRYLSRTQRDASKLANTTAKYYDAINKYNALVDTRGVTSEEHRKEIEGLRHKTKKLVDKLQKRYPTVEALPTFEKNGYVVTNEEAIISRMDKQGRIKSINRSFAPVETYNSWRAEENPKRLKKLDDIDAKYSKKIASAKKKEEKELLEFEWLDAIDEIEKHY